jgi:GH25 family lysozyme M1 (1,4-beta-N-acetylmuramidase)
MADDYENPGGWNCNEEAPQQNINGIKFFQNGFAENGEHRISAGADEHPYDTKFFRRHERETLRHETVGSAVCGHF